ncbi:hypothetical protein [Xanthobacter sediminis]
MTIAAEMNQSIRVLAGPRGDNDTRESMLARAARRAGISYRQARALYYSEAKDPKSSVVERVRAAVIRATQKAEQHARHDALDTADVGQLVARAVEMDADLRREIVALVLRRLTGGGALDRPLDRD